MLSRKDRRRLKRIENDPDPKRAIRLWLREIEAALLPASPAEVTQLSIRVVEVYCDPMQARITVGECIKRQSATTASGRGKGYPVHEACRSCVLRDIHRAMAPGFTPAPYRAFNVARENKGRAAKWKLTQCGAFGPVRTIDGEE